MKKILFFRSAKWSVIEKLVGQFSPEDEIHCLVQKNSADSIRVKYPNIQCHVLSRDFFSYADYADCMAEADKNFDKIYIPISGYQFNGLEEIYTIIDDISFQELCLVNGDGEIVSRNEKEKVKLKDRICHYFTYREIQFFRAVYNVKKRMLSRRM